MNIREALKKYFGKYEATEGEPGRPKRKKKKEVPAGSYWKKKRKQYEKMLEKSQQF